MNFPRISLFPHVFAATAALTLSGGALAQDAAKLAQEKACLACHAVDKKVVGPSYKDIAGKYRSDKNAEANLAKKIRAGGVGVWGQVPMPPNTTVSEKEAQILVKWILSQK
jgi:cytochrome c